MSRNGVPIGPVQKIVSGSIVFNDFSIDNSLRTKQDVETDRNLLVHGDAIMDNRLFVDGSVNIGGDTIIEQSLTVSGDTFLKSDIVIDGSMNIDGTIHVDTGSITLDNGSITLDNGSIELKKGHISIPSDACGGYLDMNNSTIINVLDTTDPSSAVTKNYVDTQIDSKINYVFETELSNNTYLSDTLHAGILDILDSSYNVTNIIQETLVNDPNIVSRFDTHDAKLHDHELSLNDIQEVLGIGEYAETITITNHTIMQSSLRVDGRVDINNDVSMTGDVTISGDTTINQMLQVDGSLNVDGRVDINDDVSMSRDVTIAGDTTINQMLQVDGSLNVDGSARFTGDVSINGILQIGNNSLIITETGITNTSNSFTLDDTGLNLDGENVKDYVNSNFVSNNKVTTTKAIDVTCSTSENNTYNHSLVLLEDGSVKAFGMNSYGQLGDGTTTFDPSGGPVDVSGISNAVAIAAGSLYSLVLLDDGQVNAFGNNGSGNLGAGNNETFNPSDGPVYVKDISNASAIVAGGSHSLVLLKDGKVKAFGFNNDGQLGNGNNNSTNTGDPVDVTGISNATAIAAGRKHSLVVLEDGTVKAFGFNSQGQLGDGTTDSSNVPVDVSGLTDVSAVAVASGGFHSLVLLNDGTVKAFGWNGNGQLGDGTQIDRKNGAVDVKDISNAVAIAAGYGHSLVLLKDGQVKAFGRNTEGQLGDGNTSYTIADGPVYVKDISNAVAIAAGYKHSLVVLDDGTVKAFGFNSQGQLGDGTTTTTGTTGPVDVIGLYLLNINTNLQVTGDTTINQMLHVDGRVDINNDVSMSGDVTISDQHNLTVTGDTTINQMLQVDGSLNVDGRVDINDDVSMIGDVTIAGDTTINQMLQVDGSLNVDGRVDINSDVSMTGDVTISGDTTINQMLQVDGSLNVDGRVDINSDVSMIGDLTIAGNTTLNGNVGIGTSPSSTYKLDVNGRLNMNNNRIEGVADPNSTDDALNVNYANNNYALKGGTTANYFFVKNTNSGTTDTYALNRYSANQLYANISGRSTQSFNASTLTLTNSYNRANTGTISTNYSPTETQLVLDDSGQTLKLSTGQTPYIGTTSNDDLRFVTNNTDKMRITNEGKVGIGINTEPLVQLQLNNSTNAIALARSDGLYPAGFFAGGGSNNYFGFLAGWTSSEDDVCHIGHLSNINGFDNVSANVTKLMTIKSNGNVGIGTTSPGNKLHVNGSLKATTIYEGNSPLADSYANIAGSSSQSFNASTINASSNIKIGINDVATKYYVDNAIPDTSSFITETTADNNYVNVTGDTMSGSLTIANTTTNTSLDFGSKKRQMINLHDIRYGIGVQSSTTYFRSDGNFAFYRDGSHHDNTFNAGTGGTAVMVINNSGNVGIGTTNPSSTLHVNGTFELNNIILKDHDNDNTSFMILNKNINNYDFRDAALIQTNTGTTSINATSEQSIHFSVDSLTKMMIRHDGYVGIGTMSPTSRLHVEGSVTAETVNSNRMEIYDDKDMFDYSKGLHIQNSAKNNVNSSLKKTIWVLKSRPDYNSNIGLLDFVVDQATDNDNYWHVAVRMKDGQTDFVSSSLDNTGTSGGVQTYGGMKDEHYNFTGQHHNYSVNEDIDADLKGFIVTSTGTYKNQMDNCNECNKYKVTINESLPIVDLSKKSNDKKVFGVISDKDDYNITKEYVKGNIISVFEQHTLDRPLTINSIGEGAIWVCNVNGVIENGDYITSSPIPGLGMIQNDIYLANFTVAKSTMDCEFAGEQVPRKKLRQTPSIIEKTEPKLIQKTDESGNLVTDESGNPVMTEERDSLGKVIRVTVYDESGNPIMIQDTYRNGTLKYDPVVDEQGNFIYDFIYDDSGNQLYTDKYESKYVEVFADKYIIYNDTEKTQEFYTYEFDFANGAPDQQSCVGNTYVMAFIGCTYHCG